jgi:hypothetical protein
MSRLVCAGKLTLDQAWTEIATDWVEAYEHYVDAEDAIFNDQ